MNLNKYKKGMKSTDPERGLRKLVGAQKAGSHGENPDTIRVNGIYQPSDHSSAGNFFAIVTCTLAIIASSGIVLSIFLPSLGSPLAYFLGGLMTIHGCAMIADGVGSTKMLLVRHSIKLFWCTSVITFIVSMIFSIF